MKMQRWFLALAMAAAWVAGAALAQNTVGGTVIENTATATFVDSNDVTRSTFSNTVETIVQTVYSFDIAPDDGSSPTPATDFGSYTETDGLNDASGAIGDTVEFFYTVTNDTNNDAADPVTLSLSVVQDGADGFELVGVAIEVSFDGGTTYVPYDPAAGLDLTAQGQQVEVRVTGQIPAGVDGNDVALADLVAINESAVAAGQTGPTVSFDTNNVARATVGEDPVIGVAKDGSAVTVNGDGTYTVDYLITVQNDGNVPLSSVQVVEDLSTAFPAPATVAIDAVIASGSLAANGAFDGDTDPNLLAAGSSTLPIGASESVTLTVTVTPGTNLGPFTNQVTASAESPNGTSVSDLSTDGTDPDQNGDDPVNDGDGDPTNTNSVTEVAFTEAPSLGLAKATTGGVEAAGFSGEFETTVTLTLVNDGDVELRDVRVRDVLTTTFPAPASYLVTAAPTAAVTVPGSAGTTSLSGNAAFDGDIERDLLTAGGSLAVGATATITFTVRFDPNGLTGPFDNTASTTATSPAGTDVADASVNGTDPDPDGDGDPGNDASPTPISFTEDPIVGLAKNLDAVVDAPGAPGQFDVTFTFTIENYGNVDLNDVQISDNLAATFGAPATIVSVGTPTSATLTVDPTFTGETPNDTLLEGTDTLGPAESGTVTVTVRIDPNGVTSFTNAATASGTSPGGTAATDTSHDGLNPAPGVGSDPRAFNDSTPIVIPEAPLVGAAKNLESVVNNGDGSYAVTYLVTVQNDGNVPLSSVQVTEDFATTFTGASVAGGAVTATTGGLTANPAFTGAADTALLTGTDTLAVGATGTITVVVTVTPGADLGPYENQVSASATSPDGATVTDLSSDGTDPDMNGDDPANDGDGDPTNTDSATPATFTETPLLGVAKAATSAVDAAGFPGEFETTVTLTLVNDGDVELRDVQVTDVLTTTFPSPVTYVVTAAPSSASLTGNGAFDGTAGAGANVLAGSDTLAAGATASVSFTVRFDPNGETGPFDNTAAASGTSPAGTTVSDDSFPGTDPDPDGDGPGNDASPTPITFTETPLIGVAKQGTLTDVGNTDQGVGPLGPFTVQIDFTLRNYGNVDLGDVALTDDLDAAFGAGNYTLTSGPSVQPGSVGATINVNAGYTGGTDTAIIAAGSGSSLAIGGEAVVRIEVEIQTAGTYSNQASATGAGPGGGTTTDISTTGTDPDPDGDGNPLNNQEPTAWSLDAMVLTKNARTCADAACVTVVSATGATVEPGQYLEYTLTATATGDLTDVVISDAIPADAVYVVGSISTGGQCSIDGGTSYGACPAGTSGPYPDANDAVTHVRLTQATIADGGSATLEFVVRVR